MNTRRFTRIKTLKDIKLEKARLRYEILIAENALLETMMALQRVVTISTVFSKLGSSFGFAKNVYSGVHNVISKIMFWRKGKSAKDTDHDDYRYH
jgi:hypothetical protein